MVNLDAAQAEARLRRMLQPTAAPILTDDEITDLLALVPQIIDASGVLPGASGYVPTYSPHAITYREAAAEGWSWKAAKVAGQYDVATGNGESYKRSEQFAMCMAKVESYGGGSAVSRALSSIRLATDNTAPITG